jgi:hypothetical protein
MLQISDSLIRLTIRISGPLGILIIDFLSIIVNMRRLY